MHWDVTGVTCQCTSAPGSPGSVRRASSSDTPCSDLSKSALRRALLLRSEHTPQPKGASDSGPFEWFVEKNPGGLEPERKSLWPANHTNGHEHEQRPLWSGEWLRPWSERNRFVAFAELHHGQSLLWLAACRTCHQHGVFKTKIPRAGGRPNSQAAKHDGRGNLEIRNREIGNLDLPGRRQAPPLQKNPAAALQGRRLPTPGPHPV